MNTMAMVAELADSDFDAVGPFLFESYDAVPLGEDCDEHVLAYEDWLQQEQECQCCCCTGECRQQDDYDDPLFAGFVEGDYEAA